MKKPHTVGGRGPTVWGFVCALHNASTTQRVERLKALAMRWKGVALSPKAFTSTLHGTCTHIDTRMPHTSPGNTHFHTARTFRR